jgi:hypothetical protein
VPRVTNNRTLAEALLAQAAVSGAETVTA